MRSTPRSATFSASSSCGIGQGRSPARPSSCSATGRRALSLSRTWAAFWRVGESSSRSGQRFGTTDPGLLTMHSNASGEAHRAGPALANRWSGSRTRNRPDFGSRSRSDRKAASCCARCLRWTLQGRLSNAQIEDSRERVAGNRKFPIRWSAPSRWTVPDRDSDRRAMMMNLAHRTAAVQARRWSPAAARWLALVCLRSGVVSCHQHRDRHHRDTCAASRFVRCLEHGRVRRNRG